MKTYLNTPAEAGPAEIKRTASLPYGCEVEFIWTGESVSVVWEPDFPCIRSPHQHRRFLEAYEAARCEFVRDLAATIGGNFLIADLWGHEFMGPGTKKFMGPGTKN